jgi:hypothetical protein
MSTNVIFLLVPSIAGQEGGSSAHFKKYGYYEGLYRRYNPYVLLAHAINLIATLVCLFVKFRLIPEGYVIVSPVVSLRWTNYALLLPPWSNYTENRCDLEFPSHGLVYPDFMPHIFYDFTDKSLVQYDKPEFKFQVIWAMAAFFLLSILFQWAHYSYLLSYPYMPRVLHYIEYAFSASIMIMVLAVNTGIIELFSVTGMAAAFYGMNMLGAAAEGMVHYLGFIPAHSQRVYTRLIWLSHLAGWALFFLALVPVWVQLGNAIHCSDGGTPGFLIAAVTVESVCFFLFGFLQVAGLMEKIRYCVQQSLPDAELLFKYDCYHALLSLVAKTLLAWLLMGPAASVRT